MEQEIVVRGSGEVRALPDEATLRVEITADHTQLEAAYQARAAVAARVDAVLAGHADAIARSVVAALGVQPRSRWHKGQDVRTGWRAFRTTLVDVRGLDALGGLMAGLVEAGAAVTGPRWSLAPDNPAHDAAREGAAADARRRAEAYARALGLTLGPVAWVAEPGLRLAGSSPPAPGAPVRLQAMVAAGGAAAAEPAEDLTPGELTLAASVEVGFRLG
ncbi:MAG TPA: SIMPL domain-containing protein [Acidimicrobiales bacterium]|nr:SIMPL domain-containing protein [Acidimicrobiales bacterium]